VVFLARIFSLDGGKKLGVGLFNQNVAVVHGSPVKTWSLSSGGWNKGCPGERLNAVWF
jgi:hypothetical protein